MGILYTTNSNDGMGEDYSQRNWFMFPNSKSHWQNGMKKLKNTMPLNHLKPPRWSLWWPLTAICCFHHDQTSSIKLIHPKPHLLQSCRERHSINMLTASSLGHVQTKLLTFLQVFNKSTCKLNSNAVSFFCPALLLKTPWELFFLYVHKLSWAQKGKVTKVENVQKLVGIGQLVVGPLLHNGDRLAKWKHPENIWSNGLEPQVFTFTTWSPILHPNRSPNCSCQGIHLITMHLLGLCLDHG